MDEGSLKLLERFYTKYRDAIDDSKLKDTDSVLLASLNVKNNGRFQWLKDGSLRSLAVDPEDLVHLLQSTLVRETDEPGSYVITAIGIWEVESKNGTVNETGLIEYLDAKFFSLFPSKPRLSEKEIVIVMSLIAARSFSSDSSVDLHKDGSTKDAWQKIVVSTHGFLSEHGFVSRLTEESLFGKRGNEHPVSNLIRHTDALRRKSLNLFKAGGNQTYYLDLWDGRELSRERLSHLFTQVFKDNRDPNTVDLILKFCDEIAHGPGIMVYDLDKHIFSSNNFDDVIKGALCDSIAGR